MPKFMRKETARSAERIFLTKSQKALGVERNGKVQFYPLCTYNLSVCASVDVVIEGMERN